MTIKDETTLMVKKLSTLSEAEQAAFALETGQRFRAILQNHTQGPLDDPDDPSAVPVPGVDPRNIFLTVLMLDKQVLLDNLSGKFATFINGKWLAAMDIFVQLLPLTAQAASLQEALSGVTLTQMLSDAPLDVSQAMAADVALLRQALAEMFAGEAQKLSYLKQFAGLL